MIELLMVIILVGLLSALAVPAFLDFRKEGKAAAVRSKLAALRMAVKNQTQQAQLRCGVGNINSFVSNGGRGFYDSIWENMYWNSVTVCGGYPPAGCTICNPTQIPAGSERFIPPSGDVAHQEIGGVDYGPYTPLGLPANPFSGTINNVFYYPFNRYPSAQIQASGGRCAIADEIANQGYAYHWIMDSTTGDIFAGTNTPGVNECNF
jgi:type II secretory pathway pseudopilin PulG